MKAKILIALFICLASCKEKKVDYIFIHEYYTSGGRHGHNYFDLEKKRENMFIQRYDSILSANTGIDSVEIEIHIEN